METICMEIFIQKLNLIYVNGWYTIFKLKQTVFQLKNAIHTLPTPLNLNDHFFFFSTQTISLTVIFSLDIIFGRAYLMVHDPIHRDNLTDWRPRRSVSEAPPEPLHSAIIQCDLARDKTGGR